MTDPTGLILEPPPDGRVPQIGASEAMDTAWKEVVEATNQLAILALFPKEEQFKVDTLVWLIRYEGYCAVPVAPPRADSVQTCYEQLYFTLINADTGDFIVSWTRAP